jgi:hypothetical protein
MGLYRRRIGGKTNTLGATLGGAVRDKPGLAAGLERYKSWQDLAVRSP